MMNVGGFDVAKETDGYSALIFGSHFRNRRKANQAALEENFARGATAQRDRARPPSCPDAALLQRARRSLPWEWSCGGNYPGRRARFLTDTMKPIRMLERDVLKAIWECLQTRFADGHWDRVSSPAKLYKGRPVRPKNVGMADIVGCLYGAYVAIECKTEDARSGNPSTRKAQAEWSADVQRAKGIYIIARSQEDVIAVLGEL